MKVLIIHDETFTESQIREDMHEEGFLHTFGFLENADDPIKALEECDEVWVFGDIIESKIIQTATDMGCDVWRMG